MSTLPVRRQGFRTAKFVAWLAQHGVEVGTPTNHYEVVRYKAYSRDGNRAQTHIVYAKESGLLTFTGESRRHYENFLAGLPLTSVTFDLSNVPEAKRGVQGKPSEASAGLTARRRARIQARDGSDCWFCGSPMGEDTTLEHLLPLSKGGSNDPANLVLAHGECNRRAANLSVAEKVELRSRLREGAEA